MTTSLFKIIGMHCTNCALSIDMELEDLPGISKSSTNYAKAETIVEYNQKEIHPDRIIQTIASLGYEAEISS